MARFKDGPALFGEETGCATYGNVSCGWCGTNHTDRENKEGEAFSYNDSICVDYFGEKQILDCCFEGLERAIIEAMPRILPWYIAILQSRKANLQELFHDMEQVKDLLAELAKASRA